MIYPMSILPEWLKDAVMLNPLTNIIVMFRELVIYDTMLNPEALILAVVQTGLCLAVGIYVFYKKQDGFILDL